MFNDFPNTLRCCYTLSAQCNRYFSSHRENLIVSLKSITFSVTTYFRPSTKQYFLCLTNISLILSWFSLDFPQSIRKFCNSDIFVSTNSDSCHLFDRSHLALMRGNLFTQQEMNFTQNCCLKGLYTPFFVYKKFIREILTKYLSF